MKKLFLSSLLSILTLSCGKGSTENPVASYMEDLSKPEYSVRGYFTNDDWEVKETESGSKTFEIDKQVKIDDPMLRGVKGSTQLKLNYNQNHPLNANTLGNLPPPAIMEAIIRNAVNGCKSYCSSNSFDPETIDPRKIEISLLSPDGQDYAVGVSIYFGTYSNYQEKTEMMTFMGTYDLNGEMLEEDVNLY